MCHTDRHAGQRVHENLAYAYSALPTVGACRHRAANTDSGENGWHGRSHAAGWATNPIVRLGSAGALSDTKQMKSIGMRVAWHRSNKGRVPTPNQDAAFCWHIGQDMPALIYGGTAIVAPPIREGSSKAEQVAYNR